ncbi:Hypothetical predicted protein [Mytilus galloprovincialis]|uniref:Uncharacterized protein n=1 Tax=Mytilus galloprovincialis TaxID=29158 RepID=A0A8B6FQZ2_MYTGA|nr:Hypothetical predicted protein [Mytilus galloprovincialis]
MFDVFYCVILNTIVCRFVNGDQLSLEVNGAQSEWKKSFDSCSDPTYWHQIFNDCQPGSCNVSSVADKIINAQRFGRQQYWIYGYVLRSPVIVNIGCYSLNSSVKNAFHRGMFLSEHNSALECSRACPKASTEYIFLRNIYLVTLPSDALCLMLVIDGSRIRLETEKCNSSFYSLCYVSQNTSSQQENSEATSKPSTITAGRRTLRGPVNAESDSDDDKPDLIPIVAGSVGGFVALVIVVFIVCIIQRRKKSNNKHLNTAVDEGEPETYSEPIKNTVAEEKEGIYNHLGDSEKMIEMKPQDSSIYDVTGMMNTTFLQGMETDNKDDDDLYDHGAASDVYNTLNETVTPNRPESDTYNVINAK